MFAMNAVFIVPESSFCRCAEACGYQLRTYGGWTILLFHNHKRTCIIFTSPTGRGLSAAAGSPTQSPACKKIPSFARQDIHALISSVYRKN